MKRRNKVVREIMRNVANVFSFSEQEIILGAFGYLTPSKFNQLGKTVFSFFGLSKDTPQNEN